MKPFNCVETIAIEFAKTMITKQANMKISKKGWKRKSIALSLKLCRLEKEVSLQAPCTNFWDKLESSGIIEAKV